MNIKDAICKLVHDFYVTSHEFNGLPVSEIAEYDPAVKEAVQELINEGRIVINFGDRHPNPHILAFEPECVEIQLSKFNTGNWKSGWLYPSRTESARTTPDSELRDRPYTRLLHLGEPQMNLRCFDLSVLENYRNDPRFHYDVFDTHGQISVKPEYHEGEEMRLGDQMFLNTFGFGYSRDFRERIVVVYVIYLSALTAEHQQIWRAKELTGDYCAHPGYIRASSGEFPDRRSTLAAILEELRQINLIAAMIGRPALFTKDYCDDSRPKEFAFLIRPTFKEYLNFVSHLDKMLSENISRAFFLKEVSYESEVTEADGRIRRDQKGSITILNDWLKKCFTTQEPETLRNIIKTFRKIREKRHPMSHTVVTDHFDMKLLSQQRELITEAYEALRTLRHILMNHSLATNYRPPNWLQESRFWDY